MARAPQQILVLPYRFSDTGTPQFLILLRSLFPQFLLINITVGKIGLKEP